MVELWIHDNRCLVKARRKWESDAIDTAIKVHGVTGFLNKCGYGFGDDKVIVLEYEYLNNGDIRPIGIIVRMGEPDGE